MSLRRLLLPPAVEITGDAASPVLLESRLVNADGSLVTAIALSGVGALSGTNVLVGTRPYKWLLEDEAQEVELLPTDEIAPQTWYQFVFHLQSGIELRTCTIPALVNGASNPLPLAEALAFSAGVAPGVVGPAGPMGPAGPQGEPGSAASVSDTPTDGVVDVAISSNWAFDHLAAADPHPGHLRGNKASASIQSGNYQLQANDDVVVFTATATATLLAATGSGRTYRLVCRAGTLTIDPAGVETVKGETIAVLSAGEDLILTDTAAGVWE